MIRTGRCSSRSAWVPTTLVATLRPFTSMFGPSPQSSLSGMSAGRPTGSTPGTTSSATCSRCENGVKRSLIFEVLMGLNVSTFRSSTRPPRTAPPSPLTITSMGCLSPPGRPIWIREIVRLPFQAMVSVGSVSPAAGIQVVLPSASKADLGDTTASSLSWDEPVTVVRSARTRVNRSTSFASLSTAVPRTFAAEADSARKVRSNPVSSPCLASTTSLQTHRYALRMHAGRSSSPRSITYASPPWPGSRIERPAETPGIDSSTTPTRCP